MVSLPHGSASSRAGENLPAAYHEHQPTPGGPSVASSANGTVNRLPDDISDYLRGSQALFNQCGHVIFVYDAAARVVFRNSVAESRAFAAQSQPSSSASAQSWKIVCECVTDAVAAAMRDRQADFSAVIPVQQRCYIVTGSLVGRSGRISGAIANVSELAAGTAPGTVTQTQQPGHGASSGFGTTEASGELPVNRGDLVFQRWMSRRADARRRMQKLSRREAQVASLVSQGKANKSIARELDISVKTIEKHRANAVRKLGVSSTPEMVRIAVIAEDDPEDLPGSVARIPTEPHTPDSAGAGFGSHQM